MIVTEYEVGPGAYGVALGADGAAWTSLTGRGELARVGPDGQVSHVSLDSAPGRLACVTGHQITWSVAVPPAALRAILATPRSATRTSAPRGNAGCSSSCVPIVAGGRGRPARKVER
jgi:hypothetical protein